MIEPEALLCALSFVDSSYATNALTIMGGSHEVKNCSFKNASVCGARVSGGDPPLTGCSFENTARGVVVENGSSPTVAGCTIRDVQHLHTTKVPVREWEKRETISPGECRLPAQRPNGLPDYLSPIMKNDYDICSGG